MNRRFKECVERSALYRSEEARGLAEKELSAGLNDLEDSRLSLSQGRFKWTVIQAYYAMFHGARALLYSAGYRERSHRCVVAGLEHLFSDKGLLDMKWVRAFEAAMALREEADYVGAYSKEGAHASVENAENFLKEAKRFLKA